ncbi:MAG TPA: tetratricopeptide repeat protein, partial [Ignavibacteriaceae bacterium]|nr:tetratricopeptide repeat protein [Ignavibacteriaceae bacterium]
HKALSIWINLFGKDHPNVAYAYNNIAIDHALKNEYDLALEYFQKSLDIRLPIMGEENSIIVISYTNFGDLYTKKEDYKKALEYYDKALNIGLKVMGKYHPSIAELYLSIAVINYEEKDFNNALINCQNAFKSLVNNFENDSVNINPSLQQINSELHLLKGLSIKAKIFTGISEQSEGNNLTDEINNLGLALSTYQLAVDLIDKIHTGYKSEGSKLFLGEETSEIYDQAIQTSLKLYEITNDEKYFSQAFDITEKSKAAVLQKGLYEIEAKQFGKIPAELLEDEKQLRIDLVSYDTELQNELTKKESTDSFKINEYQNKIFDLKTKYDVLISGFEKNYPEYYNLKYQTRSVSILEIQKQLDENTVLAEYFVGDSLIYVFTISKNGNNVITIQKPDNFSEIVKNFYTSILKTETEKYISSGNELSKLIVFPINDKTKSKEKLIIIPHDILFKIPFEALFTSEQKSTDYAKLNYLINSFDISYHYSSALYVDNLKKEKEKILENSTKNFVGFAPVFPKNDITGYTLASRSEENNSQLDDELRFSLFEGNKYNELKYSKWEVESI